MVIHAGKSELTLLNWLLADPVDCDTFDLAGAMKGRTVIDAGRFLGSALAADKRLTLISVGRVS